MFPAIPSAAVRVGATVAVPDSGIERIDHPASEIETAHREYSQPDPRQNENSPPNRLATDSPVMLQSTDSAVGTLLDVIV